MHKPSIPIYIKKIKFITDENIDLEALLLLEKDLTKELMPK